MEREQIEGKGESFFAIRREDKVLGKGGRGGVGVRELDKPPRSRQRTVVAGTTWG